MCVVCDVLDRSVEINEKFGGRKVDSGIISDLRSSLHVAVAAGGIPTSEAAIYNVATITIAVAMSAFLRGQGCKERVN